MESERPLPPLAGIILDEQAPLTLAEISHACAVEVQRIVELVEEGVLAPAGPEPERWRFTSIHMRQARVVFRLQNDLGVNLAGAALALQLLDELQALRARLER